MDERHGKYLKIGSVVCHYTNRYDDATLYKWKTSWEYNMLYIRLQDKYKYHKYRSFGKKTKHTGTGDRRDRNGGCD